MDDIMPETTVPPKAPGQTEELAASTQELIAALTGRTAFYQTLAGLYFKPLTQDQIDTMVEADFYQFAADEPLLEVGFNDISRFLRKRNTGTRQMLATDFTMCFGGLETYRNRVATPCASLFLSDEGLLYREPRNKVYAIFKKSALRVKKDLGVPEDHLTFELEFMGILSDRARTALQEGNTAEALENLRLSRSFLLEHILTWFDKLAALANLMVKTRFYRGVLKITEGWMTLDLQMLDDLIDALESDGK
jgi:TorA maturation chaperone TorD